MNYRILSNKKRLFDVVETTTDQVIASFSEQREARDLMRRLNLGGAFNGYTPPFFVKNVVWIKEIAARAV